MKKGELKRMNQAKAKIIGILLAIFVFLPISSFGATGEVTTETVRMREEPSTDSSILTLLSQGFEVEIIEKQGDWYKVKYGEYTGYVSAEFIQVEEEIEEPVAENIETVTNAPEEESSSDIHVDKKVITDTKLYYLPLIHSEVIQVVEKDKVAYVIQVVNGWSYVTIENTHGWIRSDTLVNIETAEQEQPEVAPVEESDTTEENSVEIEEPVVEETVEQETTRKGYINAENVNFRSGADMTSEVIDTLTLNTEVEILSEESGWYQISVNGTTGYVATTLISDEKVNVSSRSAEEPRESVVTPTAQTSNMGTQIVEYAKTFLGYPYVYGGSLPSGFDCSGFVQYVYKHFGYSVSRSSSMQAKDGVEVSLENLELGDILIFKAYDDYSRIGHVGLYIGNNQFIHANDEKTGVIITSLSYGKYPERFVCGRRII